MASSRSSKKKEKIVGLGEDMGGEEDTASWVQKSRKLEQKKKKEEEKQARQRAQALEDLDNEDAGDFEAAAARSFYLPKDIAGMKVTHDLNEIDAGENVVLTLKDQAILDENYEENEEDALENIHLTEAQRLAEIKRLKKKEKKYDVYDTDKKQDILPQYDEDDSGPAFVLPSVKDAAAKREQEQVRAKLHAMKSRLKKKQDLSGPSASSISDFRSEEEESALGFKKKAKKKRKIRTREVEESGGSLADILESQARSRKGGEDEDTDHGSRRRNVNKEQKEKREEDEKAKRDAGYAFARLKAKQKAQNEYGSTLDVGEAAMDVMETYAGDAMEELEQEEDQLYNSLARNRKGGSVKKVNASEIRKRAAASKVKEEDEEGAGGGMVFSETTEFCRLVRNEDKPKKEVKKEKKPEKEKEEEMKEEEEGRTGEEEKGEQEENGEANTEEGENGDDVEMGEVKTEQDEEEEEEAAVVEKQPLVGRGLAATLAFMQSTNTSESMYIGRKGDKSAEYLEPNNYDHIRIEHRDEFGRMITPKEAFRVMSHKFHGKPPGKNKQEKRLKRYLEDQRKNHMSATDTPLNSVGALKRAQKKTGSAFVVIDGPGDRSMHTPALSHTEKAKGFSRTETPAESDPSLNPGFTYVEPAESPSYVKQEGGGTKVKLELGSGTKRKRSALEGFEE